MTDFSFLSEPTFEKITTTYRELIPILDTSTYLEYQFPPGNYLAEAFVMIIKYAGQDLCLTSDQNYPSQRLLGTGCSDRGLTSDQNYPSQRLFGTGSSDRGLTSDQNYPSQRLFGTSSSDRGLTNATVDFGDLFTDLVPYQCGAPHPTLSKIPGEFIHAFTNLQSDQTVKTYFEIPLLKLSSSVIVLRSHTGSQGNVEQLFSMSLIFNKSAEFNQVIKQIIINKFHLDLTDLTDDQINLIVADSSKKFEFKLLYREVRMLRGQSNQGISMNPIRPYVLDRFNAQIESDNKTAILIHDSGLKFDYEYVLIKANTPSDVVLTKFEITTNLLLNSFTYTLTKEAAEIYGETFCFGSGYYLININQFIDSHINSFFAYNFEKMTEATKLFDTTTFTPDEAEELLALPPNKGHEVFMKHTADLIRLRQNDMLPPNKQLIGLDKSKLKLWIKLGFDKVITNGSVNVYCYK